MRDTVSQGFVVANCNCNLFGSRPFDQPPRLADRLAHPITLPVLEPPEDTRRHGFLWGLFLNFLALVHTDGCSCARFSSSTLFLISIFDLAFSLLLPDSVEIFSLRLHQDVATVFQTDPRRHSRPVR